MRRGAVANAVPPFIHGGMAIGAADKPESVGIVATPTCANGSEYLASVATGNADAAKLLAISKATQRRLRSCVLNAGGNGAEASAWTSSPPSGSVRVVSGIPPWPSVGAASVDITMTWAVLEDFSVGRAPASVAHVPLIRAALISSIALITTSD